MLEGGHIQFIHFWLFFFIRLSLDASAPARFLLSFLYKLGFSFCANRHDVHWQSAFSFVAISFGIYQ